MRITAIILLAAVMQVSARGYGQRVTLKETNAPLEKIFKEIRKQTGMNFLFSSEELQKSVPVTINVKDAPVEDVVKLCLKEQPFNYSIENNTIIVKAIQAPGVKPKTESAHITTIDVHGRVTDSAGAPLEGASVSIKGTVRRGVTTNSNGEFDLKNVDGNATLIISYAGYVNREIRLNGNNEISVMLVHSTSQLDQVEVIAYGITTQRFNTGDVTTVTSREIEEQPVSNVLAALEGRVPGLAITQNTGVPGGSFSVQIRGQNSLINGNDPFFVIDGVPYNSQMPGFTQGYSSINSSLQGGSPLNFINPYDIESIEVLKDADATSIYGSRAANGAILITTKKGKIGAAKVDINLYSGLGDVTHTMNMLNTQQYLEMRNEAFVNDGAAPNPNSDFDLTFWDTTRYTNWQKTLLGNSAHYDDAQLSVSGGNIYTQYLVGGGYHKETTPFPAILPGQGVDQKGSVHFNLNSKSENSKFKSQFTGSFVSDHNNVQSNDFTSEALTLPPDAPALRNLDGTLNWAPTSPGIPGTWGNPLAQLYQDYNGLTSNLVGNAILSYLILPGLQLKGSLGYTNTRTDETEITPTRYYDPGTYVTSGGSSFNSINSHSWIIEPLAEYRLQIVNGKLDALVGATFSENDASIQNLSATGFSSDAVLADIQAATSITANYTSSAQYKYNAFFGRLNYGWEDKYLVNLSARRDGSSRFGPGKQFANFGAVGVGWIFSKEVFFQRTGSVLSFGKIRASYGTTGNDQIGDYRFLDLYSVTQYPYQGIQGFYPANLFNPNLAWEVNKKLEGGLDLGFFKDRIFFSASYFRNRSGNQLISTPVSAVTGFGSVPTNLPAVVQNTGQEYVVNTINIKTKTFNWSSSFNLTIHQNKLISFPNLAQSSYSTQFVIGQPTTIREVFHSVGVNDSAGIYEFASFKGNPTYTPSSTTDRTTMINTAPKYYGGFSNRFSFKSFSLDIFFQFVKQTGNSFLGAYPEMPGTMVNQPVAVLNRWQKQGDVKPFEQFSQNFSGPAYNAFSLATNYYSDLSFGDASFIRLKNLAFSWLAPEGFRKSLRVQTFKVYVLVQNLLTITKYNGIDPETQGINLPPMKVYTLGLQFGL